MQSFHIFMCEHCGYSRQEPGICPNCQLPLEGYSKETQSEYGVDMEDAMRTMSETQWYV